MGSLSFQQDLGFYVTLILNHRCCIENLRALTLLKEGFWEPSMPHRITTREIGPPSPRVDHVTSLVAELLKTFAMAISRDAKDVTCNSPYAPYKVHLLNVC